jgi:hypothetical protein
MLNTSPTSEIRTATSRTRAAIDAAEAKHGVAFLLGPSGELRAATHVSLDGRLAMVTLDGDFVRWSIRGPRMFVLGDDFNRTGTRVGWFGCLRRVVRTLRSFGCTYRVRPGERAPRGGP